MNKQNITIGLIFILLGVWFYSAMSSFKIEPGSYPKKLLIREGTVRSSDEVVLALSAELKFDLEGAYRQGFTTEDVMEYLMNQPHTYQVSFDNGVYYEGRRTVLHFIPLSICVFMFIIGAAIIIFKGRSKNDT